MALTFTRWILAAVVGCALVAALVLRANLPTRGNEQDVQLAALERSTFSAQMHASQAATRLRILQVRDSVMATLPATRNGPVVLIDAALPPTYRPAIEELMAARDRGRGVEASYPGVVAFVLDSARSVRGAGRAPRAVSVDFVLPAQPGQPCLTLVRLDPDRDGAGAMPRQLTSDATSARLLGPCAFYEAFGVPGPAIASWLTAHAWSLGLASGWQQPMERWNPRFYGGVPLLGEADERAIALRDLARGGGARCITGDPAACRTAVVNGVEGAKSPVWGSIVSPPIRRSLYDYYSDPGALGPHEISYLGDMEHALGPEKFARFWRSSLRPDAAFRDATGQDIGDWTVDWSRQAYGSHGRGPAAPRASVVFAIVIVLVAGAVAMRATTGRQVAA